MRYRKATACAGFAGWLLACRWQQPRRQFDVPYVSTTEEAVRAMLKLADVKHANIVYDLDVATGAS